MQAFTETYIDGVVSFDYVAIDVVSVGLITVVASRGRLHSNRFS